MPFPSLRKRLRWASHFRFHCHTGCPQTASLELDHLLGRDHECRANYKWTLGVLWLLTSKTAQHVIMSSGQDPSVHFFSFPDFPSEMQMQALLLLLLKERSCSLFSLMCHPSTIQNYPNISRAGFNLSPLFLTESVLFAGSSSSLPLLHQRLAG